MPNYLQGKFTPKNPSKYVGDVSNIIYRSSWELKVMIFFDTNPNILKYGSEELIIPYISPVDNLPHRYYTDFAVQYKTKLNEIKKAIVEIKPLSQCKPPEMKSKVTKRYITETKTYLVNQAKWKFAKEWCSKNGWDFLILTEKDIGV